MARSIQYQLTIAKLPLAKDLVEFDFASTPITEKLVRELATGDFLAEQRNAGLSVEPAPANRILPWIMAIQRRRPGPDLIPHSDRSNQYAVGDYHKVLQAAITQSMSRKANWCDNALPESFFATLKTELVHQREYPDRNAARRDLCAYIEGWYNRRRPHSAIGYIIPEQADRKIA